MIGKLFIVSAPSGAGKTSLVNAVIQKLNPHYTIERALTYTTRQPRHNEIPGIDYHFISSTEFEYKIMQGFFIEWSTAYGVYYGSSKIILETLETGQSVIIIVDRQGAKSIVREIHEAILVWIAPSSPIVLAQRLNNRSTETPEQIMFRLAVGQKELQNEVETKFFTHHIINDDFHDALADLELIICTELSGNPEIFHGKKSFKRKF